MATHLKVVGGHEPGFAKTHRTDNWWVAPGITFFVFSSFVVYTTWALLQAKHYYVAPYLSPFYSPVLFTDPTAVGAAPEHLAWFGTWPSWWPGDGAWWFLPASPAILILIFPLSFRMSCYYYRKAYYRAFAGSPPGCAVGPLATGKRKYRGESALLLIQNLHRFALYFALIFIFLLGKDAVESFFLHGKFGVGVGSIIITINVILIACYTFGCHSLRHLIGGRSDCMSCGKNTLQYSSWKGVSWFNARHAQFAWASLLWVMVTDVYVRLVSMGVITDLNTW
jgi:hypothetical protein